MRTKLISLFIVLIFLVGCTNGNGALNEREKLSKELDPARNQESPADTEFDKRIGYVNYKRDQLEQDRENNPTLTIDRNKMADMIARVILRNEGFIEIATLVTDKEVLIAYEKNEALSSNDAADMAKRTALSMMPRYFKVYVSEDASLIPFIQSMHHDMNSERDYQHTLKRIINEMKQSPQGYEQDAKNK
ncbi:YhcN/YlaJ family sporulation lipoprotein [Virgibacillus sp. MG-45]|uniref:YhcN/YlaJ family sporulation lipoprotein n=1 Tax=Virgibacillus sp. MG-45 TaxID=3102791 RepID=UPI002ED88AAC